MEEERELFFGFSQSDSYFLLRHPRGGGDLMCKKQESVHDFRSPRERGIVSVNLFDVGFHQVILNEVKNLTIPAHEILLPPRRDQDD